MMRLIPGEKVIGWLQEQQVERAYNRVPVRKKLSRNQRLSSIEVDDTTIYYIGAPSNLLYRCLEEDF